MYFDTGYFSDYWETSYFTTGIIDVGIQKIYAINLMPF